MKYQVTPEIMMSGNRLHKRRTTYPPYDEASGLSQRDQALERIERLLSEQLIVPYPEEIQEGGEETTQELVDLDEVVEEIKIQAVPMREADPPLPVRRLAAGENESEPHPGGSRLSIFHSLFQAFILLFVLGWVFILGIMVGRGHLWESGFGHDLVAWVEQKVGWSGQAGPELVVREPNPVAPVSSQTADSDSPPLLAPALDPEDTTAPESNSPIAEAPASSLTSQPEAAEEAYPVWNWAAWEAPVDDGPDDFAPTSAGPGSSASNITVGNLAANEVARAATAEPGEQEDDELDSAAQALEADNDETALRTEALGAPAGETDPADSESETGPGSLTASAEELPGVAMAASGDGKFAVQIALAFDEAEAERRVARLAKQGFTAYFYKNTNNRYPVRVGHFSTRQDADAAKVRLEMPGYKGPYVSSLSN